MEITIHQALFGYDGGHQLLAASVGLPTDSKHHLAVATDLSGSAPPSGFDQAYCGFPVPGSDFYALFATWLAPEMPRPGCVWSHVVLIEFADLALLPDLGELRQLFRRPAKPDDQTWRNPILFSPHASAATGIAASLQPDGAQLLELLYVTPTAPAVMEVQTAETCEDLVFAIWSQQWPRLRRSFRFSTGSFADRGRAGTPFDLQLTPLGNLRAWQRVNDRKPLGTLTAATKNPKASETWLLLALADLCQPDLRGFRTFLHTNGPDISEPRAAFARLATAYEVLQPKPNDDWLHKFRAIAVLFPQPPEAVRLKQSVVAPKETSKALDAVNHAWATVSFLFTASEAAAYAEVPFDHAGLVPLVWEERREDVLSLLGTLVRKDESPAAVSFAVAIANILQSSDLKFISERYSELIPVLLSHRPSLAFAAATWQLRGYIQSHIYEVLSRMPLPQEDWAQILGAMLIAGTHVSVRDAVERAGPLAMRGAFCWLDHGIARESLPSQTWREALATPATQMLTSGASLQPSPLALCAWCALPGAAASSLSADRPDIQQLANQPLTALVPPLRVATAFLLMALGLKADAHAGLQPIVRSFFVVHDALASGDYASDSWRLLAPQLPYLGIWRDWDRCEKLRRAARDWLEDHVKSGNPLGAVATSAEQRALARRVFAVESDANDHID